MRAPLFFGMILTLRSSATPIAAEPLPDFDALPVQATAAGL